MSEFYERSVEAFDVPAEDDPARVLYQHLGKAGLASDIEFERPPESGDETLLTRAAQLINQYYGVVTEPVLADDTDLAGIDAEKARQPASPQALVSVEALVGQDVEKAGLLQHQVEEFVDEAVSYYPQLVKGSDKHTATGINVRAMQLHVRGYSRDETVDILRDEDGEYVSKSALFEARKQVVQRLHGTVYPPEALRARFDEYLTDDQRGLLNSAGVEVDGTFNQDPPNANAFKFMRRLFGDELPRDLPVEQNYIDRFAPQLITMYEKVTDRAASERMASVVQQFLSGMTSKEIVQQDPSLDKTMVYRTWGRLADTLRDGTTQEWLRSQYEETVHAVQTERAEAEQESYIIEPEQTETSLAHNNARLLIADVISREDLDPDMTQAEAEDFVLKQLETFPQFSGNLAQEIAWHMRGWDDLSIAQSSSLWITSPLVQKRRTEMIDHVYERSWEFGGQELERFLSDRRAARTAQEADISNNDLA